MQQLRSSEGEQPALQSQQQQQQHDSADAAGGRAECTEGNAALQPLSPAEPLAAGEAEQPDMPATAAAYSSDDDGGGYEGGDWGGDSDVEAAPGEVNPGEPRHNPSVDSTTELIPHSLAMPLPGVTGLLSLVLATSLGFDNHTFVAQLLQLWTAQLLRRHPSCRW